MLIGDDEMQGRKTLLVLVIMMIILSCRAPLFSVPDTGRIMQKGESEIVAGFTSVYFNTEERSDLETRNYGFQALFGAGNAPLLNIPGEAGFRFEYASSSEVMDWGYLRVMWKLRLSENVALGFNSTLNYRENSLEYSLLDPGCLITIPVTSHTEANLSAFLTVLDSPADDTVSSDDFGIVPSCNFSLSIGPDLDKWAVRPAVGYLWDPDDMHTKWCWSIFLAIRG